jgi:hypothetical protein
MSQDYHIYLHSEEGNSLESNTQPKEEAMGGAFKVKTYIKQIKKWSNMSTGGLLKTGAAELATAHPYAALAVAAVKGTEKVLSMGFQHLASYTGNYQYSMEFNNFMTIINMTPVSLGYRAAKIHFQTKKFNEQQEAFRELMGENFLGI